MAAALVGTILRPNRWPDSLALAGAAVVTPWIAVPAVALAMRGSSRRADRFEEVLFLQSVAAELRAGASLRQAILSGSTRTDGLDLSNVARRATAGRPMSEVADLLRASLPSSGALVATTVTIGAETGGNMAAAFSTMAAIQSDAIELERDVLSSTATVRASMVVVGGLPLVAAAYAMAAGQMGRLLDLGSLGWGIAAVGLGLLAAGGGLNYALLRSVSQ